MEKTNKNNRIKKLKAEIKYNEEKMKCCAYSKSDLLYLRSLKLELKNLTENKGE